ncbi:MAG: hypothetical protein K0S25_720, partial [Bacillus sp. (in: firmicutes)]|nr:hypothetical protein [Bacillus sp. (in: firmicutes)]
NVEEKLSLAVQEDVPGKIDTEVNKDTEQDFDRGKPFPK